MTWNMFCQNKSKQNQNICKNTIVHTITVSEYEYQSYCIWKTLFPGSHPSPLAITIFPLPLPHTSLSLEGRVWWRHPIWYWIFQRSSLYALCPVVDIVVNYHLLQKRRFFDEYCMAHRPLGTEIYDLQSFYYAVPVAE